MSHRLYRWLVMCLFVRCNHMTNCRTGTTSVNLMQQECVFPKEQFLLLMSVLGEHGMFADTCFHWLVCCCFRFAELEVMLSEAGRARGLYELAISQPVLDMPEAVWKAYIDFEISQVGSGSNQCWDGQNRAATARQSWVAGIQPVLDMPVAVLTGK